MTKEEALKLALDALRMADELCRGHGVDFKEYGLEFDKDIQIKYREAIAAIKEALAQPEERNFCPRCGKRLGDMRITDAQWSNIHTCTPPDATGSEGFYGLPHGLEKRQTSGGNGVTAGETAPTKDPTQKVARLAGQ